MSVYVIIPACNEAKNIGDVIKKVRKHTNNIIVVDDGSKDKTYEIARKNKAVVLRHVVNMGKGAALKTGCDYALKQGAKKIIVLDADGQHDPKEIPVFLKNLNRNEIVFGGRKLNKKMPFVLKFGNLVLHQIAKSLYNIDIKDTQCGYRAFTANAYKKIRWKATDYSMESEMIANVSKNKLKYKEIPIETIYSDKYKGTTILDGMKIAFNMFLWKFRR